MSGEILSNASTAVMRKRAAQACLACRVRKVRCDVTERGPPCMHCRLDHEDCIVKKRPAKYRKDRVHSQSTYASFLSKRVHSPQKDAHPSLQEIQPPLDLMQHQDVDHRFESSSGQPAEGPEQDDLREDETRNIRFAAQPVTEKSNFRPLDPGEYLEPNVFDTAPPGIESESQGFTNTHLMYSYYSFLQLDTLQYMTSEDVNFMESQGCFQIPVRSLLDHFVKEYFLHVHPGLPVINEGDFWDMYTSKESPLAENPRMSLFLFQAMIFSSSCFVSMDVIRNLGFTSARNARAAYYRRAKLLFDFEGDRSPISTAQGALLLSYQPPTRNHNKINTFWLGIAIQLARDAGAHHSHTIVNVSLHQKNVLKRLWWGCILRDRIISLGVRRPLQINSADFVICQALLSFQDLQSEIGRSKVHSAHTKGLLSQLTIALCELAAVLTEVIMLVYPLHDSMDSILSNKDRADQSLSSLATCRSGLAGWFRKIFMSFPHPSRAGHVHKSVILYTDLMYIYYYSAILAISQFEILVSSKGPIRGDTQRHRICRSKAQLEEATNSFTEILKELNRLELAKYLPISVVAYSALPFVLHILDVKITATEIHQARKQKRLKVYSETMKVFKAQYDVTEEVSDIIATMIDYVSVELPMHRSRFTITNGQDSSVIQSQNIRYITESASVIPTKASSVVNDWGGVLLRQPNLYLRFALTIDLALEKGHFPNDSDFPVSLQWRSTSTTRFPMYRITLSDVDNRDDLRAEAGKSSPEDRPPMISADPSNDEHTTNSEYLHNSPTSMSLSTNVVVDQIISIAAQGGISQNNDLDLSMDFGPLRVANLREGDVEFTCAATWPELSFSTCD